MADAVLAIEGLTAGYDEAAVIRDVSLDVAPGEVVALLGPNGAGKTTTLRAISGLVKPMERPRAARRRRPRAHLAERARPPRDRARSGRPRALLRADGRGALPARCIAARRSTPQLAYEYFPKLEELQDRRVGLLSGGEQQMLAVGRALARHPRVLLLDELSLGLAPVIVERLLPVVRQFAQERDCAVLLVEQHVHLALEVADRGYVLTHGEISLKADAARLRADRHLLVASYLGEQSHEPTTEGKP